MMDWIKRRKRQRFEKELRKIYPWFDASLRYYMANKKYCGRFNYIRQLNTTEKIKQVLLKREDEILAKALRIYWLETTPYCNKP